MKILLATDGYPPIAGGLESHVRRLANYLYDAGHVPVVVTAAGGEVEDWEVITGSTVLGRHPSLFINSARHLPPPWADSTLADAIETTARRHGSDVIHAHGWCASSAARAARRVGIPLVVTLHDYGLLCPMRTLLNGGTSCSHTAGPRCVRCVGSDQSTPKRVALGMSILVARKRRQLAPKYLAVSTAVVAIHHRSGMTEPMEVVPNFLDVPDVPLTTPAKDGPILFIGPSNPAKGFAVVAAAHRHLLDRGCAVTFQHVGGSTVAEAPSIIGSGRLSGGELEAAFNAARLVVVPSIWEDPCPTVALEAMARGRAVVASGIGGLNDIVEHGTTGLLVRPNDPRLLADAIGSLLDDKERTDAMGVAGQQRFRERFSTDQIGPMIERAYAEAGRP